LYKTLNFVEARRLFLLRCFLISQSFKERLRTSRLPNERLQDLNFFISFFPQLVRFGRAKVINFFS